MFVFAVCNFFNRRKRLVIKGMVESNPVFSFIFCIFVESETKNKSLTYQPFARLSDDTINFWQTLIITIKSQPVKGLAFLHYTTWYYHDIRIKLNEHSILFYYQGT